MSSIKSEENIDDEDLPDESLLPNTQWVVRDFTNFILLQHSQLFGNPNIKEQTLEEMQAVSDQFSKFDTAFSLNDSVEGDEEIKIGEENFCVEGILNTLFNHL